MADEITARLRTILKELYAASDHAADSAVLAENAVQFMEGKENALQRDIQVRIVKGGTYKIKDYYLENNELTDIRGASAIITEVQERIVPNLIWEIIGFDGVVYNGGGNMLAVIPANTPENIGEMLEKAADRCLLTANVAYVCTNPIPLSELLGKNYKKCISHIEQMLTEHKKSRAVCDLQPVSGLNGEALCGVELHLPESRPTGAFCSRCCKRIASYQFGTIQMCGGCAHKYLVGAAQKQRYAADYIDMLHKHQCALADQVRLPQKYEEIDEEHIAVVYADGNNMGGLIQNIEKITDMMDFSEFVKKTMPELVFRAMESCKIKCFELVAVGGDDVFILLPGDKAIAFSYELIKLYKTAFDEHFNENHSTLSVGVSIAKPDEKIKFMLESAEEKLHDAKHLMKQNGYETSSGSLSFAVMDSYEGLSAVYGKRRSMLPYSFEQLLPVLKFANQMQNRNMKTRIRNIAEAYANAESTAEMSLFFRYVNAKETKAEKKIQMPVIPGYTLHDGFYKDSEGNSVAFWEDVIDLMKYYDGSSVGKEG